VGLRLGFAGFLGVAIASVIGISKGASFFWAVAIFGCFRLLLRFDYDEKKEDGLSRFSSHIGSLTAASISAGVVGARHPYLLPLRLP
jgi:hypothetical protein